MAENFSRNEKEYNNRQKTVTMRDYLGYSNIADVNAMQINDLVMPKNNSSQVLSDASDLHFNMIYTDIANRIEDELAKFWTNKQVIRSIIKEINKHNVLNFIKNMLTISNTMTVLGDIKNYISYSDLKHIVQSFLTAAEELGFSESSKFRMLVKEYRNINQACMVNANKSIDKNVLCVVNIRVEKLFEDISKYVRV